MTGQPDHSIARHSFLRSLRHRALWPQVTVLTALLLAAMAAAAGMGYIEIGYSGVVRIVWSAVTGSEALAAEFDTAARAVVLDVRLPRILTAVAVGGALAVAGAVFQGILLNPLADPYTLGVSSGAAFGACAALLLNITALGMFSVPLFAFAGAVITLMVVIYLASSAGGFSSNNLILSGIIVAAILSAGISFFKYADDERVSVLIFWLMGSLSARTWSDAAFTGSVMAIGTAVCFFFARDLNLMSLGTRTATSLGVDVRKLTPLLLVCASLMAAICVSITGIIGFVGLLVPHLVRSVSGPDNSRLIPLSMLTGGLLLLAADTLTRSVLPEELPIGVGPGDPDHITLKAIKALRAVDVIFTAGSTKNSHSLAVQIAAPHIPEDTPVHRITFPMCRDQSVLEAAWKKNARIVASELEKGRNAAFLTLGDCLTYSTYGYLARHVQKIAPKASLVAIPGITSYQAAAARVNRQLVEGEESLVIMSGVQGGHRFREVAKHTENAVFLKAYKNVSDICRALEENDWAGDSVGVVSCGLPNEKIIDDLSHFKDSRPDYWTLILAGREKRSLPDAKK